MMKMKYHHESRNNSGSGKRLGREKKMTDEKKEVCGVKEEMEEGKGCEERKEDTK